jgi:hypothetical protein
VNERIDPGECASTVLIEHLSATIGPKWESVEDCAESMSSDYGYLRLGGGETCSMSRRCPDWLQQISRARALR